MDSTGLKVYGEGEWHKNTHGQKRPTRWKKLHITFDPNSGQILSAVLTDQDGDDGDDGDREQVIDPSLAAIPEPIDRFDRFVADGAYDKTAVDEAVQAHTPPVPFVVPPRRNAVYWDPPTEAPNSHYTHQRNLNQHTVALTDQQTWAAMVDDHQRSLVETHQMGRIKGMFSASLSSRCTDNRITEAMTRCFCLNTFSSLLKSLSPRI